MPSTTVVASRRTVVSALVSASRAVILVALLSPFTTGFAEAQRFEAVGTVGGQFNGSIDFSTALFHGLDIQNSVSRGLGISFEPQTHTAVEFMWTYNNLDAVTQLASGRSGKLFSLDSNQYFGNVLFHFATREKRLRPYALVGVGASDIAPVRNGVTGDTTFAFALGAGVKYNFSHRFGLRFQTRWFPTYFASTNAGYWCNAAWGGCWAVGQIHYLQAVDTTLGLTFRF